MYQNNSMVHKEKDIIKLQSKAAAYRTIKYYKKLLQVAENESTLLNLYHKLVTDLSVKDTYSNPKHCEYCKLYLEKSNKTADICSNCPISIATGDTSCIRYPEMEMLTRFLFVDNLNRKDLSYDIKDIRQAIKTRINFHMDLIKSGGIVPENQAKRFKRSII
jgi:hypothetical protein